MKTKYKDIYHFEIRLEGIEPTIWRRIQVPETYSFWDLHVSIQDAMGWFDSHLHRFVMTDPSSGVEIEIGIPLEEDLDDINIVPGWKRKIAAYFTKNDSTAKYVYDFGDNWVHTVKLLDILPGQKGIKYPICTGGERACPPEDCGGIYGYQDFLEVITDPFNERYAEMMEWVGKKFDPEDFDIKKVKFDNPEKRWEIAFAE